MTFDVQNDVQRYHRSYVIIWFAHNASFWPWRPVTADELSKLNGPDPAMSIGAAHASPAAGVNGTTVNEPGAPP